MTSFKHDCVQHRIAWACNCGAAITVSDCGVSDVRCECGRYWTYDAEARTMRLMEIPTGKPTFGVAVMSDEELAAWSKTVPTISTVRRLTR